jgi:hypothetical protein
VALIAAALNGPLVFRRTVCDPRGPMHEVVATAARSFISVTTTVRPRLCAGSRFPRFPEAVDAAPLPRPEDWQ